MILGLDAATRKTVYSILNEKMEIIEYGLIRTISTENVERMKEIYEQIDAILSKYPISNIVVEDVPVNTHNNLKTGKDLSVLQGVILALSFKYGISVKLYNPSAHRSINGLYDGTREGMKREFQKEKAVEEVNSLYGLDFKYYKSETKDKKSDDDMAEAILIARAFIKDCIVKKEEI